ncbi:hypothetical protein SAMN06273572_104257 [Monaibacterium marinum]|uniref:Uncharacterized protein n=2 Tax=Pontivivens marinum TaxID=1690039 RepID=A0A2C9CTJ5_9RHOB|nr:hypothetical protein SAMN06273572_104257 [Monaibacterium marinum]
MHEGLRNMTRILLGMILTFTLTACNIDLVLPKDEEPHTGNTVVDLNERTLNTAVVDGQ